MRTRGTSSCVQQESMSQEQGDMQWRKWDVCRVLVVCIMEGSRASGLLRRNKNPANAACGLAEGRENPHPKLR